MPPVSRAVVPAALLLLVAGRLLSLGPRASYVLVLAPAAVMAVVLGGRLLARWRLARLPTGGWWRGAVAIDVADFSASPRLAPAAPRPGVRRALLLAADVAPGMLVVGAAGLSWEPGVLARWSGARAWQLAAHEVMVAELGRQGRVPGLHRTRLRLLLADRSLVALELRTPGRLQPALDQLGVGHRRMAPW